jgi:hypothetical protein
MSDLELIGMRDDARNLYVASVLGCLGTLFAVVIYRNAAGLRGIHEIATTREPADAQQMFESMDYLKVEWCRKGELQKSDLRTLQAAGYQPKGRGPVWPRFESATPGWYPWGLAVDEARLMTGLLEKVARFIHLRKSVGTLHSEPIEARIPIVPSGGETSLTAADIEWLPFLVPPSPISEPMALAAEEEERIRAFPAHPGLILEMIMPLVPEMACLDEAAGRPYIPRVGFIVECRTRAIVCARLANATTTFAEGAARALAETLRQAKVRPGQRQLLVTTDDN